eukprot:CAMPEP_0194553462 /NCGR_PEP_ID=MMETSP0253-20130528/97244_1 /TAXON_ID=2966 /ORGANISM="Noctiluca scintillans" /LENGTH=52 /DNA_ID=CAMNT_0039400941 /DNA_START=1190 /DNA_END=1349 /DNA_ORIENTATION=-
MDKPPSLATIVFKDAVLECLRDEVCGAARAEQVLTDASPVTVTENGCSSHCE